MVIALLIAVLAGSLSAAADPAMEAYQAAEGLAIAERWEQADAALRDWLEQFPEHAQAARVWLLLAEVQSQRKDFPAARQTCLEFLTRYPEHASAHRALYRAAEAARLAGWTDQAQEDFERFHDRFPDDPLNAFVFYHLGESAMAGRDWVQARRWLQEGLRAFPDGPLHHETRFLLGRCLESQGEVDLARAQYRQLVRSGGRMAEQAQIQLGNSYYTRGRYEQAAEEFQQAIRLFPDGSRTPDARYWLGMAQVARQRWAQAIEILHAGITDHPEHELASAMAFWLAEAYRRHCDADAARLWYQRTVTDWPQSAWADDSWLALIQAAFAAGDDQTVLAHGERFERDHRSSPLRNRVRQLVGRSWFRQQRFDQAVRVLSEIVGDADSGDPTETGPVAVETPATLAIRQQTLYYLAQAHLGNQQPQAALRVLDRIEPERASPDTQRGAGLARAVALIELRQFPAAIALLEPMVIDPPSPDDAGIYRLHLVVAHARLDQLDQALEWGDAAFESAPRQPLVWQATQELAEAAYRAARYDIAERYFHELTEQDAPDDYQARAWSGIGWVHHQQGDMLAAAAAFGRVADRYPAHPVAAEARWMQAGSWHRSGRTDEALAAYRRVIDAADAETYRAEALFEAAGLLESQGDRETALQLLDRLVEEYPSFEGIDAALYRQAWLLSDLGRPGEANRVFQTIYDQHPTSQYWADAAYRLAEHAARDQRLADAERLLAVLAEATEIPPEILVHTLYLQGQLAASSGRWDRVVLPLERLLATAPDSPLRLPAEYWLAEARFQKQQWDRAAQSYAELDAAIRTHREPWMAMIPLRRSQILVEQQQWDEAYELAQSIAGRFPGFRQQYEADYIIGRCLAMKARFDEARHWYERVVRSAEGGQTETAAKAQWMIGESYLHQKDYVQAIRAYQRVVDLFDFPRWQAAALLQAGKCYELQGEPDEAVAAFTRIVRVYPDTDFVHEASQRLRRYHPDAGQTPDAFSPAPIR